MQIDLLSSVRNFLIVAFLIIVSSCANDSSKQKHAISISDTASPCLKLLHKYSPLWLGDSLGIAKVRLYMIDSLLRDCDFTGYYWNEIKPLLGEPFAQRSYGKDTTYYKYRVSWFPESYYDTPGNVFLMVDVINDTITWFKSLEIDG